MIQMIDTAEMQGIFFLRGGGGGGGGGHIPDYI